MSGQGVTHPLDQPTVRAEHPAWSGRTGLRAVTLTTKTRAVIDLVRVDRVDRVFRARSVRAPAHVPAHVCAHVENIPLTTLTTLTRPLRRRVFVVRARQKHLDHPDQGTHSNGLSSEVAR